MRKARRPLARRLGTSARRRPLPSSAQTFAERAEVAIETAAGVQEDIVFWNSHTANDTWTIVLNEQEVSELYETDRCTIRFTAGGRSKSVEVSKEKNGYVFEMLSFLFRARRYSDPTAREYLSPDCLP